MTRYINWHNDVDSSLPQPVSSIFKTDIKWLCILLVQAQMVLWFIFKPVVVE